MKRKPTWIMLTKTMISVFKDNIQSLRGFQILGNFIKPPLLK